MDNSSRPAFPRRVVVTAGMPYGNKTLHFAHIAAVFVHADFYARFLRDRIGAENVIFVSGTDCYGSPISEYYRKRVDEGNFSGTIEDFVRGNHEAQKRTLEGYNIGIDLFAASGLGRAGEIHAALSAEILETLHAKGVMEKITSLQFYDPAEGVLLNGRQVVGQCPIEGCSSEKGYADECDLGHQYMPGDLINPKSALSGMRPEMRAVTNWYFRLPEYNRPLTAWVDEMEKTPGVRPLLVNTLREFLKPPVIYVKKEQYEALLAREIILPPHTVVDEEKKSSVVLEFADLAQRETAAQAIAAAGVRFRTGKTLVPFRLTGNAPWSIPAPAIDGLEDQTFWVWPESLWAPISFTKAYLEETTGSSEGWTEWWCAPDAAAVQFIGQDNIYFYGLAEPALFMALRPYPPSCASGKGDLIMPTIAANHHLLFLDKKASSSGAVKPPMADELLEHYTPEQLRAHFLGLGLGLKSVGIQPKPFNPKAGEKDNDPALREGNLFTNVLNRAARTCFYSIQTFCDGKIPVGKVSNAVAMETEKAILAYETMAARLEFHNVMTVLDGFFRYFNKELSARMKAAESEGDGAKRTQALVDGFYMLKAAAVLAHPIAPQGADMLRDYLGIRDAGRFFSWETIFEPLYSLMDDPEAHRPKVLEPRVDFFGKHPSQF